jgi:CheY-like chemotaxis protein
MNTDNSKPAEGMVEILLIEDSEPDVELTKQGLVKGHLSNRLHVAYDGEEAMAFLRRQGKFARAPRPDLILLDLNLPRKDGREVLTEIKNDAELKLIPVVVLTTSDAEEDVVAAYARHVNAYMNKPVDFHKFVDVVKELTNYWFVLVKLPPLPKEDAPPAPEKRHE